MAGLLPTASLSYDVGELLEACWLHPEDPTLYIQDSGAGVMTGVNLSYEATGSCGIPLDVKVDVYANEIEDFHIQETAIFFRNGMPNNRVGMFVAAQYCVTDANGQCVKDPVLDTREYIRLLSLRLMKLEMLRL